MAYNVVRNKRTGYVSFVEKVRDDKGNVKTKEYVCGLGTMEQAEFKAFQKWAHSIKDQGMRKDMVLACPMVVEEKEKITQKVAKEVHKKTTVKRPKVIKPVFDEKERKEARKMEHKLFRQQYEEKKQLKVAKVKRVKREDGIRFTRGQSLMQKRELLDERITQLKLHIENSKSDIRGWQKGRAGGQKIADAKEKIAVYEGAVKTLKKQRAELRR